jgi:hypothetical protein
LASKRLDEGEKRKEGDRMEVGLMPRNELRVHRKVDELAETEASAAMEKKWWKQAA